MSGDHYTPRPFWVGFAGALILWGVLLLWIIPDMGLLFLTLGLACVAAGLAETRDRRDRP